MTYRVTRSSSGSSIRGRSSEKKTLGTAVARAAAGNPGKGVGGWGLGVGESAGVRLPHPLGPPLRRRRGGGHRSGRCRLRRGGGVVGRLLRRPRGLLLWKTACR